MSNQRPSEALADPLYQKLFRIFSYFADLCPSGTLSPAQSHFILQELQKESGQPTTSRQIQFDTDCVTFRELLNYIEVLFPDRKDLEPSVDRVFERLISQIIRKGFLQYRKRGRGCNPLAKAGPSWRSAWVTVSPGVIHIWPLHRNTHSTSRKSIVLDKNATVQSCPMEDDRYVWQLDSGKDHITFGHFDELWRNTMVKDFQLAIDHRTKVEIAEYDRRRAAKMDGRTHDRDASWRIALEAENRRLEEILDGERRALKDEEIVRALATRMLEEEREKNERLERIMKEMEAQLLRQSVNPSCECTTVTVDLERIEEEGVDEVEVVERSDDEQEDPHQHEHRPSPDEVPFTSDDPVENQDDDAELNWQQEQYLITSTQSI